ncbi:MAG TPA: histidine phosphatase [Alphaproteobacteria bacterium]|nr:histidine phosphatase [Alphaproteobacteria bacterium]
MSATPEMAAKAGLCKACRDESLHTPEMHAPMPFLILVRHAKSVDRMDAEDDFARGLTPDGRDDAARAGVALAEAGVTPSLALVSPAQRTKQTWSIISDAIGDIATESPMALYHASQDFLERAARDAFDHHDTVVMVGHNPGIGALAHDLGWKADAAAELPDGYPTSAATVFEVDAALGNPRLVCTFDPMAG